VENIKMNYQEKLDKELILINYIKLYGDCNKKCITCPWDDCKNKTDNLLHYAEQRLNLIIDHNNLKIFFAKKQKIEFIYKTKKKYKKRRTSNEIFK
jgi:hypothetical protein